MCIRDSSNAVNIHETYRSIVDLSSCWLEGGHDSVPPPPAAKDAPVCVSYLTTVTLLYCCVVAEFSFDGFSVDMTRSMVAMSDVSLVIALSMTTCDVNVDL